MSVMFKPMPSSKMASIQADRSLLAAITLASVAALAGCLVPEKFTAKVDVEPDASYTFRYSGTVMHALAAAQIKQVGSLSPKDDAQAPRRNGEDDQGQRRSQGRLQRLGSLRH